MKTSKTTILPNIRLPGHWTQTQTCGFIHISDHPFFVAFCFFSNRLFAVYCRGATGSFNQGSSGVRSSTDFTLHCSTGSHLFLLLSFMPRAAQCHSYITSSGHYSSFSYLLGTNCFFLCFFFPVISTSTKQLPQLLFSQQFHYDFCISLGLTLCKSNCCGIKQGIPTVTVSSCWSCSHLTTSFLPSV